MQALNQPIVIDTGSYKTKAGRPADLLPTFQSKTVEEGNGVPVWPVQHGQFVNQDALARIWLRCIQSLKVKPADASIVLIVAVSLSNDDLELAVKTMFEKVGVSRLAVVCYAAAALYAAGRTTGAVVSSGAGLNYIATVRNDIVDLEGCTTNRLAGNALTDFAGRLLAKEGHNLHREVVQDIKEGVCCLAIDYQQQMLSPHEVLYSLPNKQNIDVSRIRFTVPEGLFDTALLQKYDTGLGYLAHACLSRQECQQQLSNIVLAGGSTLFPGFAARLNYELSALLNQTVSVLEPPHRQYLSWIGAAKLSQQPSFQKKWITRDEYHHHSARIVHSRYNLI